MRQLEERLGEVRRVGAAAVWRAGQGGSAIQIAAERMAGGERAAAHGLGCDRASWRASGTPSSAAERSAQVIALEQLAREQRATRRRAHSPRKAT